MDFRKRIEEKREDLIADLQGCIRIPSVYAQDDSGYPYGKAVQDCLEYMLDTAGSWAFPYTIWIISSAGASTVKEKR